MDEQTQNTPVEVIEEPVQDTNQNYIDTIASLKANSVSKELYQKALNENKNLLNALANGETVSVPKPVEEKRDLNELRKELFYPEKELNDIEYVSKALELRERVLEETGEDCFVPKAHDYTPSAEAYASAEKTAQIFRECLDYANGDNSVFIAELQRRTNDVRLPNRK